MFKAALACGEFAQNGTQKNTGSYAASGGPLVASKSEAN